MAATCAEKHRLKMWEVQLPCTNLVMWKVVDGQSQTRKLIGKTGENGGKTGENRGKRGKLGENGERNDISKGGNMTSFVIHLGYLFVRAPRWRPDDIRPPCQHVVRRTSVPSRPRRTGLTGRHEQWILRSESGFQYDKKDGLRMFKTLPMSVMNCNDCLCRRSISKILSWGCSPCFFWHTPASCRKC